MESAGIMATSCVPQLSVTCVVLVSTAGNRLVACQDSPSHYILSPQEGPLPRENPLSSSRESRLATMQGGARSLRSPNTPGGGADRKPGGSFHRRATSRETPPIESRVDVSSRCHGGHTCWWLVHLCGLGSGFSMLGRCLSAQTTAIDCMKSAAL